MSDTAVQKPATADIASIEKMEATQLLDRIQQMSNKNLRFITATCMDMGDRFDVYYHFDDDIRELHLQVSVAKDETLPSISGIYLAAFLVENEMKELFGVNIQGIQIDYHGRLYLSDESEPTPMAKNS